LKNVIPNAIGNASGLAARIKSGTLANGEGQGAHPIACTQMQSPANTAAGQTTGIGNPAGTKIKHVGSSQSIAHTPAANTIGQPTSALVDTGSTRMCVGKPELFAPRSAGPNENALSKNTMANDITTPVMPAHGIATGGYNCTTKARPKIKTRREVTTQRIRSQSE
jgi:hypothetical protein